jgi:hypothetical protein
VHKFDTFAVETQQKCSFFFGRDVAAAARRGMKTWLVSEGCTEIKDYFLTRQGGNLEFALVVTALDADLRALITSLIPELPGRFNTTRKVLVRIYDMDFKTLALIQ